MRAADLAHIFGGPADVVRPFTQRAEAAFLAARGPQVLASVHAEGSCVLPDPTGGKPREQVVWIDDNGCEAARGAAEVAASL